MQYKALKNRTVLQYSERREVVNLLQHRWPVSLAGNRPEVSLEVGQVFLVMLDILGYLVNMGLNLL